MSPAIRTVSGPGGAATAEPKVMQVLLALADAGGQVVTRAALQTACWNDRFVGDDAINRAVGEVRRALRTTGGSVRVETTPKVGWRLTGIATDPPLVSPDAATDSANPMPLTRRALLVGAAVVAVASGGGIAAWTLWPDPRRERAGILVDRAMLALREAVPGGSDLAVGLLRDATMLAPDDGAVWGKLALAWSQQAEEAGPRGVAAATAGCQAAAARALRIDPRQPDALAALATLAPTFGDWAAAERRLRDVLTLDPRNEAATAALGLLLMATGRVRDAAATDTLLARFPLSPVYHYRAVYRHWALGELAEMDRLADRAMQLWPRHYGVWMARLWTQGYTQRGAAALAMIADAGNRPDFSPPFIALLQVTMTAFATREAAAVRNAITANRTAANRGPVHAVAVIQHLAALGDVDGAFEVADAYLLRRGPGVLPFLPAAGEPPINDQRWRKTMMLWIPAAAAMRADARFLQLCRDTGLLGYWRATHAWPDFTGNRPLPI